ncbi:MAG: T9SS type A sorting domain-containing protein [Bacteroidetes bacterium]|nr:T9SS type A sorting domain-containing protein [Bacteroidota bacterium]
MVQILRIGFLIFCFLGCVRLNAQLDTLANPSACGLHLTINNNSCPSSGVIPSPVSQFVINTEHASGAIMGEDVFLEEIRLIIQHDWLTDLNIILISPSGVVVPLSLESGGAGDVNFGNPLDTLCQEAFSLSPLSCIPIDQGEPPFTQGTYLPDGNLFLFNDGSSPLGNWTLEICDDHLDHVGFLEFVQLVFAPMQCLFPSEVEFENIEANTLELSWWPEECGNIIIEYGPPGFLPGIDSLKGEGDTVLFANCPPFLVNGLQERTSYDLYLRTYCEEGNYSTNSCVYSFTTDCLPPSISSITNFDDQDTCQQLCGIVCPIEGVWQNSIYDDMDWLIGTGTTLTPNTGPVADVSDVGNYLYLETTGYCQEGKTAYLESECLLVDLQGRDSCYHISFNYQMLGGHIGTLALQLTEDNGVSWQTLWSKTGDQLNHWYFQALNLSQFDGKIVRMRFSGTTNFGPQGDIALDEIILYGLEPLGIPQYQFFADRDEDTFGNPDEFIFSCDSIPPVDYVLNAEDCKDTDGQVNPLALEIPCNGVDDDCKGEDQTYLNPPLVTHDTVCNGEQAILTAFSQDAFFIQWYDTIVGGAPLSVIFPGNNFTFTPPVNNSPFPVYYRFYVEAISLTLGCDSSERIEVVITVLPQPNISTVSSLEICPYEIFDLNTLVIEDSNFTGGQIDFYRMISGESSFLENEKVHFTQSDSVIIRSTTSKGCFDEISLFFELKEAPELEILPSDSFSLCLGTEEFLEINTSGGGGDYQYFWNNGITDSSLQVHAATEAGILDSYFISVTDSVGCFVSDSVKVLTVTSVSSVNVQVNPVTFCLGDDGQITVSPLDGQPPFNYYWSGGGTSGESLDTDGPLILSDLTQASYRVSIIDSSPQQCEFVTSSIQVNGPDAVINSIDVQHLDCFGDQSGAICLFVSGNNPSYSWSNGATTPCVDGLSGGKYSVTVLDGVCEIIIEDIGVEEPDSLWVFAETTAATCHSFEDGAIHLSVNGGNPGYQYSWEGGGDSKDLLEVGAGWYKVTISDEKNCSFVKDSIKIEEPPQITISLQTHQNISCFGLKDGILGVSASGGTPGYSYLWDNSVANNYITGLSEGAFTVEVTDLNSCISESTFEIQEPDTLSIDLIAKNNPSCPGATDGGILVNGLGGTPPYSYQWNTGVLDTNALLDESLIVGEYTVSLTDTNDCPITSRTFQLEASSQIEVEVIVEEPTCQGVFDGEIQLSAENSDELSYNWDTGDTTALLQNIGIGEYALTIFDIESCRFDTTILVNAPQAIDINLSIDSVKCHKAMDANVFVNPMSGTSPYFYTWNTGQETDNLFGVEAGEYVCTITDAVGCVMTIDTIVLADAPEIEILEEGIAHIKCSGDNSGLIELSVVGGSPPYLFRWNSGAITEDIFNLAADNYILTVQDAKGCIIIRDSIVIEEPEPLTVSFEAVQDDVCSGNPDGSIYLDVEGGVPLYNFQWTSGDTTQNLVNIPPGEYGVTISDRNGCKDTIHSIKLRPVAAPLHFRDIAKQNIDCYGSQNGKITVELKGGTAPFTYLWSAGSAANGATTSNIIMVDSLAVGSYAVTIQDALGCFITSNTISIEEPPKLFLQKDTTLWVTCFGGFDGEIQISTEGGTLPYEYQWINDKDSIVGLSEDLIGVPAGTYQIVVKDTLGCRDTLFNNFITESGTPIIDSLISKTDAACFGDSTGKIDIWVNGGVPPYLFEWDFENSAEEDLANLPAGQYKLTVTDADNCQFITEAYEILEPSSPILIQDSIVNVRCFEEENGAIFTNIIGGTPPYDIFWSNSEINTESIVDLPPGEYTVEVRDSADCMIVDTFEITQPWLLNALADVVQSFPGEIQLNVSGGTEPYSFWWNTGDTTQIIADLGIGDYEAFVTDANGCTTDTIYVTITKVFDHNLFNSIRIFPNPTSGQVNLDFRLKKIGDIEIEVYSLLGETLYSNNLKNNKEAVINISMDDFPSGIYWLQMRINGLPAYVEKIIRK